jgi:hypothetical protein
MFYTRQTAKAAEDILKAQNRHKYVQNEEVLHRNEENGEINSPGCLLIEKTSYLRTQSLTNRFL